MLFHDFFLKFMLLLCLCRWNYCRAMGVTFYSSWSLGGAVRPPAGPEQNPGGGPSGEGPEVLQQQKQLEIQL